MAPSCSTPDHVADDCGSIRAARETCGRIARKEILAEENCAEEITAEMIEAGARMLCNGCMPDWLDCERVAEIYVVMRACALSGPDSAPLAASRP